MREAALESLRRSANALDPLFDPINIWHARWAHALFHQDADVRRRAIDRDLPQAGPRWHRHLLDFDPTPGVADAMHSAVARGDPVVEEVVAILQQIATGAIAPPLARLRLSRTCAMNWSNWLNRNEPIDPLLELFAELTPSEAAFRPTVRQRFAALFARGFSDAIGSSTPAAKTRRADVVQWIKDRYAGHEWPDEFARLAVALQPSVLVDGSLSREKGRHVAAVLAVETATARGDATDLEKLRTMLVSDQVRRPNGAPDLYVVGCLLIPFNGDRRASRLAAAWTEDEIALAAAVDPESTGLAPPGSHNSRAVRSRSWSVESAFTPPKTGNPWPPKFEAGWGFPATEIDFEAEFFEPNPRTLTPDEEEIVFEACNWLDRTPPPAEALPHLRAALELGPAVDSSNRWSIADVYRSSQGSEELLPFDLAAELRREQRTLGTLNIRLLADLSRELLIPIVRGVLLANANGDEDEFRLIDWLRERPYEEESLQAAYGLILAQGNCVGARREARQNMQRTLTREIRVSRLARTFAWGIRLGRVLTGSPFRIELLAGEPLGYTRLKEDVLYISAMPILRGEANGDVIVRGLIVHEYGHHLYHKSPEAIDVWAEADAKQLGKLLNLVADEHLERNLRNKNEVYGTYLKTLNAYAFQRRTREIPLEMLLQRFGPHAFDVLTQVKLGVAYDRASIAVQNGKLLRLLDAGGNSFARFMRALRMGLGNRSGDPKVAEALRLFKGNFRHSDMAELYEIAKKLAEIFGDETKLLDWMDQDRCLTWSEHEAVSGEDDLNRNELNAAIASILGPQPTDDKDPNKPRPMPRGYGMNMGPEAAFNRIEKVVKLPHDPAQHAVYARKIAREAVLLRQSLRKLGLGMRPEKFRTQGRRFDRTRANALILKGDPRVLWARSPHRFTDLFLGVVVDCSGSMAGDRMEKAKTFAALLAESVRGLREVDLRVFGFTDRTIYDAGTAARCAAHGLWAHDGNNDAAALWHAYQEAQRSQRKAKLLVMISDGLPTECSVTSLRTLVGYLSRRGYCCAQVAVAPISEICFPNYVLLEPAAMVQTVRKFAGVVTRLVERALGRN